MAEERSFDVVALAESEHLSADLKRLGSERDRCLRSLDRLKNEDTHKWKRLQLPKGAKGSWVLVPLGRCTALCQWSKGIPELWEIGGGRGCLSVVRILNWEALRDLREIAEGT